MPAGVQPKTKPESDARQSQGSMPYESITWSALVLVMRATGTQNSCGKLGAKAKPEARRKGSDALKTCHHSTNQRLSGVTPPECIVQSGRSSGRADEPVCLRLGLRHNGRWQGLSAHAFRESSNSPKASSSSSAGGCLPPRRTQLRYRSLRPALPLNSHHFSVALPSPASAPRPAPSAARPANGAGLGQGKRQDAAPCPWHRAPWRVLCEGLSRIRALVVS